MVLLKKNLWCYGKNNDTIPKTMELCYAMKKTIMVLNRKLRNFDLLLKKKLWYYTEIYGTLIYYGKNYGTMEKTMVL